MTATAGRLVAVIGPSGAGKDSVLRYAKQKFRDDDRFVFPRRVVTRLANAAAEDHDSLDEARFDTLARAGAFALSWEAHGLKYGVPGEIDADLSGGRVVAVNLSRAILHIAHQRYPRIVAAEIVAAPETLAQRIALRGREARDGAVERSRRGVPPYPASLPVHSIHNDGPLAEAGEAFCALLERSAI